MGSMINLAIFAVVACVIALMTLVAVGVFAFLLKRALKSSPAALSVKPTASQIAGVNLADGIDANERPIIQGLLDELERENAARENSQRRESLVQGVLGLLLNPVLPK